jgi:hypothetical protein
LMYAILGCCSDHGVRIQTIHDLQESFAGPQFLKIPEAPS